MENILQQINALNEALQALQPIAPEFQRKLDKKFRLEFNYNSNHLEGNTLTYGETELLLIFDNTKGNHTMREYEEMQAHDVALRLVQDWAHDHERPLSEADIKELNKIILVRPYWKDAITPDGQQTRRQILVGEYKKHPNSVRLSNGELFDYASPTDTPIKMGELIQWFRTACEKGEMHPVELATRLHHQFVLIHPFDDGNGRISRLLMNYVFWRFGYPPIIIKSKDKLAYLQALNRADIGEMDFFVEYIGLQMFWSLEVSIKAAKGENIEEPDDVDKEIELLKRELTVKTTTIDKKYDYQSIVDAIEYNIIPIFQHLEQKLETLNVFFMDKMRLIYYSQEDKTKRKVGSTASVWETLIQNWLKNNIERNRVKIKDIHYSYELKGLVKSSKASSFVVTIDIFFDDYHCLIFTSVNKNEPFKYPYGAYLTKEEMGRITSPLLQDLVEQIRQSSSE